MSFLTRVLDWTKTQPLWISDLFRRSLECSGSLLHSPQWDEIRSMVRNAVGVPLDGVVPPDSVPAVEGAFDGKDSPGQKLVLKAVTCSANISAIPDDSTLPFGHEGLTAVYGENGSGKSSYSRVLKKACRARHVDDVHPNLYKPKDMRPATAKIRISLDGSPDEDITWTEGLEVPTLLSRIAVFDSKCGRVILDKENELHYSLYGAFAFTHAADAMMSISTELSREKPQPRKPELRFSGSTAASAHFQALNENSTRESFLKNLGWQEAKRPRLEALRDLDRKARSSDFEAKIKAAKSVLTDAEKALGHALSIRAFLQQNPEEAYNQALMGLAEAKEEQSFHAASTLGEEPLPHAGSQAWRSLYLAAREYSMTLAYPDSPFPNPAESSRCVFCMQELDREARERLKRFEAFMDDRLSKKVQSAEQAVAETTARIFSMQIWATAHFTSSIATLIGDGQQLQATLLDSYQALATRMGQMKVACESRQPVPDWIPIAIPQEEFNQWAAKRQEEILAMERALDPEQIGQDRAELQNLEDELRLFENQSQVLAYLDLCSVAKKYDSAIKSLNHAHLSRKSRELSEEFMTPALEARLAAELAELGAGHLAISFVSTRGQNGKAKHKIHLKSDASHDRFDVSSVLSEGEQKVIALAGFFAELAVDETRNPIVFDDPVTSLDHKFRKKIAARLAKESLQRQVVVFTHDIAFLLELEETLESVPGSRFAPVTVDRLGGAPGYCHGTRAWHAMKVSDRIKVLNSEAQALIPIYRNEPGRYNEAAGIVFGKIRETLEALVEEALFNGVLKRHASEIKTQSLREVAFDDPQFYDFNARYDTACTWMIGHDKSKSLDTARPVPAEVQEEIKGLAAFLKSVNENKEKLKGRRTWPKTPAMG